MKKYRLILPPATETEWRWREYKAYVAVCGDYADYEVVGGKATPFVFADALKEFVTGEVKAA